MSGVLPASQYSVGCINATFAKPHKDCRQFGVDIAGSVYQKAAQGQKIERT
jgi:hypothetical protein